MHKLRSSFFYFLFPIVGGTFCASALCLYYSRLMRTRTQWFAFVAFSLGLLVHLVAYNSLAQALPAPFYLRDFLNHTRGATINSLLGLCIAFCHLVLLRAREKKDVMFFIEQEWPTIPNLLCCVIGGLVNIALVAAVHAYYN